MSPATAVERGEWIWMPHNGHLIVGHECRFHLTTKVGDYIVSTVGEWMPDEAVREIHAQVRGITLEGRGDERRADFLKKCGWMEIGLDRTYETMVFKAAPALELYGEADSCCPWRMNGADELDMEGYLDAGDAYRGHLAMCEKWSER